MLDLQKIAVDSLQKSLGTSVLPSILRPSVVDQSAVDDDRVAIEYLEYERDRLLTEQVPLVWQVLAFAVGVVAGYELLRRLFK